VFFPLSMKDLDAAYDKVLAEIKAQYTLGYVSSNARADGTWRKVQVTVTRPGLKVRTRRGYFAPFRKTP
jgi:VWFA-related protein